MTQLSLEIGEALDGTRDTVEKIREPLAEILCGAVVHHRIK